MPPPPPPPPSGQASVPFVPSSNYATPPYPPPPPTSTTCVVSHYGNGVSSASSAFQIPSSRNMHQEIPPPRPSVELNLSAYCNPLDLNDQNQITSDGCPAAAAATTTSTLSTSSVICPEVHQNTFSSMPYNVNISTNQLQEDVATTTTTKEESHLESEIDDKVTVDYM
ncbi:unnamed protein product [Trichobilharzia regenti]|nr:unnamed protein product [Trichobilharzia regenti]